MLKWSLSEEINGCTYFIGSIYIGSGITCLRGIEYLYLFKVPQREGIWGRIPKNRCIQIVYICNINMGK